MRKEEIKKEFGLSTSVTLGIWGDDFTKVGSYSYKHCAYGQVCVCWWVVWGWGWGLVSTFARFLQNICARPMVVSIRWILAIGSFISNIDREN